MMQGAKADSNVCLHTNCYLVIPNIFLLQYDRDCRFRGSHEAAVFVYSPFRPNSSILFSNFDKACRVQNGISLSKFYQFRQPVQK